MFFLPVFYYAIGPYRSSLSMEEREIMDDTFFSDEEQIKYAPGQIKTNEGGAGEPTVSDHEPEKQGGIGGP